MAWDDATTATTVEVPIKITVESDIETDVSGRLNVVTYVFIENEEDGTESHTPFEDIIDNLIEFYRDGYGATQLYAIAHELTRYGEMLRTAADGIEGKLDFPPEDFDEDLSEDVDR
jgi:hypothetical protein